MKKFDIPFIHWNKKFLRELIANPDAKFDNCFQAINSRYFFDVSDERQTFTIFNMKNINESLHNHLISESELLKLSYTYQ